MTDLEKFIDCYKQFGIDIITETIEGNILVRLNPPSEKGTHSDKFDGYMGFFSDLEFTKDGKFIKQGFWEA